MPICVRRIYDPPDKNDGLRVLVDRLWPRGMSKDKASVDQWLRDIAPSTDLRKWYQHDPKKWPEFKRRYYAELESKQDLVQQLRDLIAIESVTLLFASREENLNHAIALKDYLTS